MRGVTQAKRPAFVPNLGATLTYTSSLTSSTNVWVTITAGTQGNAPGMASPKGNTTRELRVAELKAMALP